jgi:hypothetical protein
VATKKDLVEAHAFSRRRLVTAFVSGAPGGREVEPPRPMRAVVGGAALCVLLLAGAAIAGIFSPKTPDGWLTPGGLVSSKERGSLYYVAADGDGVEFRPIDATSAQLLLGPVDVQRASQEEIDKQVIGPDMGIAGAPSSLPPTSHLVEEGWTACTRDDRGIMTRIAPDPGATEVVDGAKVVQDTAGQAYLITYEKTAYNDDPHAVSYELPHNAADGILGALDLTQANEGVKVDPAWLTLFKPADDPLDRSAFKLGGSGPISYGSTLGGGSHNIGDLVTYDDTFYLLTKAGPAELTPFALAVYQAGYTGPTDRVPRRPAPLVVREDVYPGTWPSDTLVDLPGDACAKLVPRPGSSPTIRLVRDEVTDASPTDAPAGHTAVRVEPGYGALMSSGDFDKSTGSIIYLIDAKGVRYRIKDAETLEHLGYSSVPIPSIPDSWLNLFGAGPELSATAAGEAPDEGGS